MVCALIVLASPLDALKRQMRRWSAHRSFLDRAPHCPVAARIKLVGEEQTNMANRYGEAALLAARMETYGKAITPLDRWKAATAEALPHQPLGPAQGTAHAQPF